MLTQSPPQHSTPLILGWRNLKSGEMLVQQSESVCKSKSVCYHWEESKRLDSVLLQVRKLKSWGSSDLPISGKGSSHPRSPFLVCKWCLSGSRRVKTLGHMADPVPVWAHSGRPSTSGCVRAVFIFHQLFPWKFSCHECGQWIEWYELCFIRLPFDTTSIDVGLLGVPSAMPTLEIQYFTLSALDVEVKHIVSL